MSSRSAAEGLHGTRSSRLGRGPACDNRAVATVDDRFEILVDSLVGYHRAWVVYLGLELGLLDAIRASGAAGLTPEELAARTGCATEPINVWALASEALDLADFDGERLRLDESLARILLDQDRPEYLGGQFHHTIVAGMDYEGLAEFFRTGRPAADRPDRYRASIERLTVQDITVFFEEALAALPDLVVDLVRGIRVADVHCGGGRWLVAMARRFPASEFMGVEFEKDSVARARANVEAAGLTDRIRIVEADIPSIDESVGRFDMTYFQYALHQLQTPADGLRAGWAALRPGGRLVILDWTAPDTLEEYRSAHGQLVAGLMLDELYSGARLFSISDFERTFAEAGLPAPTIIDLPSGATLLVARKAPDA